VSDLGLWLVVTGTGRCGTKFMSKVLGSVGVNCTHQQIFRPSRGGPGSPEVLPSLTELCTVEDVRRRVATQKGGCWGWEAESSWLAPPFLGIPEMEDVTVVHLVRHPKRTIDSLVKVEVFEARDRYGLYYDFAYEHVPEMRGQGTPKRRAAAFWVQWNRMVEPHADVTWRVEQDPRGLLDLLGIGYEGKEVYGDTTCNGRGGPRVDVKLGDLGPALRDEVLDAAARYGYEWSG
jgi:hypothetical protein